MSQEKWEDLQRNFLIGNCKHRPAAWHNDPATRARLGLEDNHYDDPIPYDEVVRRLFSWKPLAVPKANLVPCSKRDANWFMPQEVNGEMVDVPVRIMVSDREQGIVRSDTNENIATHSSEYRIHDYEEWLLKLQTKILGTKELSILGAGIPRNGRQAYVQIALPEKLSDDQTGQDFMPYILGSTSLDGSLPTTFGAGSLLVVCDNTRNLALRQQQQSGRIYKAKHTSRSLDSDRINDVRSALRIIHKTAESVVAEMRELASISVTNRNLIKVMDIIIPIPDEGDASQRAITIAQNKRDSLMDVYHDVHEDTAGMMGNQQGTALGVVQAVNTWMHYVAATRGSSRFERNIDRMLTGKFDDIDRQTVSALATVLNKPELVKA